MHLRHQTCWFDSRQVAWPLATTWSTCIQAPVSTYLLAHAPPLRGVILDSCQTPSGPAYQAVAFRYGRVPHEAPAAKDHSRSRICCDHYVADGVFGACGT